MAEEVIQAAERDDFVPLRRLISVLASPYTTQKMAEDQGDSKPPPDWAKNLRVSCSS